MAQPDRMGGNKYLNSDKRKEIKLEGGWKNPRKHAYSEEELKSITVPGQSKTIKQLMDRYEKGRPIPEIQ